MSQKTAWGEIELSVGETGTAGAMATTLTSVGYILENSFAMPNEEGTTLSLNATGGVRVDEKNGEPRIIVNCTLIGIEKAAQFWGIDTATTGKTRITSFTNDKKFSVRIASKVVGSEALEAPECKINGLPQFSETEGWTVPLVISILKGEAGYYYDYVEVTAPVEG